MESNNLFDKAINDEYFKDIMINSKEYDNIIKGVSRNKYLFSGSQSKEYEKFNECFTAKKFYVEEPIVFEDINFEYYINEDGFRGRSFKKFDNNNINILFLGCSITQGLGLPEDQSWYKKLIKKIESDYPDKKINYYNLSVSGIGYEVIFKNMITFLNFVGKPDFIFCLLPQISRQLKWHEKKYMNLHLKLSNLDVVMPKWMEKLIIPIPRKFDKLNEDRREAELIYTQNYSVEDSFMKFCNFIHFVETLCKMSNIKFIWSTWFSDHEKVLQNKNIGFENYFKLNLNLIDGFVADKKLLNHIYPAWIVRLDNNKDELEYPKEEIIKKQFLDSLNINDEPFWTSARDGWHPGAYTHNVISDKFYKELKIRYNKYIGEPDGK